MFGQRVRIPKRWQDVNSRWMGAALSRDFPNAIVNNVELVTHDDGSNRRARFGVTYAAGTGPSRVFLKAHAPANRVVHLRNGNLWGEARLFAARVPLPVDHPRVFAAVVDYLGLDFLLVMEDLAQRGADPRDATRPMSPDQVARGLEGLARLHSRYWGARDPKIRGVQVFRPTRGWQAGLKSRIPIGLARAADTLPRDVRAFSGDQILGIWTRYVSTLARHDMTLLHGDAHIGNTYVLPEGEVGFLDWQVVRRGNWSQDVGHFMIGALTIEDRRAHEAKLIALYRDALELPSGEKPSLDAMWRTYRSTPAYGLGIWLSTLGSEGYQRREISQALSERFAASFVELDTMKALAEIGA